MIYCRLVLHYIQWRQNFSRKPLAEVLFQVSRRRVKNSFRVARRNVHGLFFKGFIASKFLSYKYMWGYNNCSGNQFTTVVILLVLIGTHKGNTEWCQQ